MGLKLSRKSIDKIETGTRNTPKSDNRDGKARQGDKNIKADQTSVESKKPREENVQKNRKD